MFLEARAPSSAPGQKKVPQKSLVSEKMGMKIGDIYWGLKGNCMGFEVVYKISGSLRKMMGII